MTDERATLGASLQMATFTFAGERRPYTMK